MKITENILIPEKEIKISAVHSQGAGGQNVNKVSTAIHLRFDVNASSLPEHVKKRLLRMSDHRITGDGIIVIKSQRFRTQNKNRSDAFARLRSLIRQTLVPVRKRKATRPTRASKERRLKYKAIRSQRKKSRSSLDSF